jgi:glutathione S-transferase
MIMQSGGMFRWAGRLSGHYPEDPAQMLEVEEIIGLVEDLNKQIMPSMYIARMPEAYGHFDADKDKLAAIQGELRKKIVEPTSDFHRIAKLLESKLEGSSSGWFCGDKPTCADIEMFVKMRHLKKGVLDGIPTDIWKTYPKLEALHDKMAATPGAVLP